MLIAERGIGFTQLTGQSIHNVKVGDIVTLNPTVIYGVNCKLCNSHWTEEHNDLRRFEEKRGLQAFFCRNSVCRLEFQRAVEDNQRRAQRRADAAFSFYGG